MRRKFLGTGALCLALAGAGAALLVMGPGAGAAQDLDIRLRGLRAPVRVVLDGHGVPHIYADSDHDAAMATGWLHARDRFFQMDLQRRQFSGTVAELRGASGLSSDIQMRQYGLRRAAEASLRIYAPETLIVLEAYAAGVNAWLEDAGTRLPPEYETLELTKASVPRWTPLDTVVISKGKSYGLSFDLDLPLTLAVTEYLTLAALRGVDGTKLLFDDVLRPAPFDPSVTVPGFLERITDGLPKPGMPRWAAAQQASTPEKALRLARRYVDSVRDIPLVADALNRRERSEGSNWFVVNGRWTDSGNAMLANDPHLSLTLPSIFYEMHITVANDPVSGPLNVAGVSFPGTPGIVQGCNERLCWGSTVNPMDVTDTYWERLVVDPATGLPAATLFQGRPEPLVAIPQTYRVNQPGSGRLDDVTPANVGPAAGGVVLIVPRRNNGPIIALDVSEPRNAYAISVQYTGWGATRDLESFQAMARSRDVYEFRRAVQLFDTGSQNFAVADVNGNIAYFAGGELPLREDLEMLGRADGSPPFMLRDGTNQSRNEWMPAREPQADRAIPYAILPADEMPHVINPPSGYIVNGNNDPVGVTLGNDPLERRRRTGGIYYLNVGYDGGFRAGRIEGLLRDIDLKREKISLGILAGVQANHQMLDAQVLTPHILAAWDRARIAGAAPELAALSRDTEVAEAVGRLRTWNYGTLTGLKEGYDPGDNPWALAEPSVDEMRTSVAAAIYSVWRARVLANTIDAALGRLGLDRQLPPNDQSMSALRRLLENFGTMRGRGASGVNFFEVRGAANPEVARDVILLRSLKEALDLLASESFALAFGNTRDQNEYRWGRLHRIVFNHPLGGALNAPPAGGLTLVRPTLPGVARSGGFQVVDASGHSARSSSVNAFMYGSGASRRFVGELAPAGIVARQIIPGGQSGVPGSPHYASKLPEYLVNSFHALPLRRQDVEAVRATELNFRP